jgi:hypothetical protein
MSKARAATVPNPLGGVHSCGRHLGTRQTPFKYLPPRQLAGRTPAHAASQTTHLLSANHSPSTLLVGEGVRCPCPLPAIATSVLFQKRPFPLFLSHLIRQCCAGAQKRPCFAQILPYLLSSSYDFEIPVPPTFGQYRSVLTVSKRDYNKKINQ